MTRMAGLVDAVQPHALADYLDAGGWSSERHDQRRSIWRHQSGARVFVPGVPGPDVEDLLQVALREIARVEQRAADELAVDLVWSRFDRLDLRREAPLSALALRDAIGLHTALTEVLVAAARAAHGRRASYPTRPNRKVDEYVDRVQLVPPEQGSFVIQALLPVHDRGEDDGTASLPGLSRARAVSKMVIQGTRAAVATAHDVRAGAPEDRWSQVVVDGVSANLCDALARLPGDPAERSGSEGAELGLRWSWMSPDDTLPRVTVPAAVVPALWAGSDYLRGTLRDDSPRDVVVVGAVTHLHRERPIGAGEITVRGHVDGWDMGERSFRLPLDEVAYRDAVGAHEEGRQVHASVRIRRRPRRSFDVLAVHWLRVAS